MSNGLTKVDVLLDETGDLPAFNTLSSGPEVVAQRIVIRLETGLGEWIFDKTKGLPFVLWVTTKPFPVDTIGDFVRAEVEGVNGVQRIDNYEVDFDEPAQTIRITGDVVLEDETELQLEAFPIGTEGNSSPAIFISQSGRVVAGST